MPPPLTPEQLAALPHDDAGPRINGVVWSLTAISGIFLALRLYCKATRSKFWWDDWVLVAAWLAIFVNSVLVSLCINLGVGKHTWDFPLENLVEMVRIYTAAGTLAVCASIWSKTSFALTILRLAKGTAWLRGFVWFLIISLNVFMGLTGLFNYIHCWPVNKLWDFASEGTCWPVDILINYDIFSAVYSGVVDVILALIPWKIVWGLQMRKKEKVGVVIAMSMGVFAGVTSFIKAYYMPRMTAPDIYDMIDLNYWSNAESTVTIIAASIPVLRVFFNDVKKSVSSKQHYASSSGRSEASKRSKLQQSGATTLVDDSELSWEGKMRILQTRQIEVQVDEVETKPYGGGKFSL
ncbi:hypothetical protein B0T14DRAFT_424442 [Immersiella caudata]|uniref:Rhodopsin domain-containing protein n=1 Tax=Immersiella caudata TaxID=314043 RepID=A0AA39X651_9PEZI|nr:hypothetical protein B0T14DRAFT_424442 [Immersiella caudata]